MKYGSIAAAWGCILCMAAASAEADAARAGPGGPAASSAGAVVASAEGGVAMPAHAANDGWFSVTNACLGIAVVGALALVGRRRGFE